ncbi:DNA-binding transcriptional regulator, LacI/PurR family [Sinosporangium album]|uniref:DNA-binding transcriptional regulator, LacI/PurR family n=1 Tax=Sinosporangium album TaxID=504805 RepID=A0A1G8DXM8_9ACTN|nr:LacI family DNA-binding transcriptional regulator [Sinosporangium album]SDH62413.1 DNA-binding transcriptional regulator, LacI/PurR family [Sinosporangium album]
MSGIQRTTVRPTLEAVAARAGVGRGTVSRVVNGSPKVSERARDAVLQAIDELGYVPNRAARSLVTRRTDTVALVVSESRRRIFDEPFFADTIRGIGAALSETGLQLILAMAQSSEEHERLARYLTCQHVDGVLLLALPAGDPLPSRLEAMGVPTVIGGRPVGVDPACYVDVDNRAGARLAVEHLIARGRRRIAAIAGSQDIGAGVDRLAGFHDAADPAGVAGPVAYGDFSEVGGMVAMRELLAVDPGVDAVFAASDPMAIGAMRVLRERGLAVPGDIAVAGFDDSGAAAHTDPPLTTVHQPTDTMGRRMAHLLIARINGDTPLTPAVILSPHLVARAST